MGGCIAAEVHLREPRDEPGLSLGPPGRRRRRHQLAVVGVAHHARVPVEARWRKSVPSMRIVEVRRHRVDLAEEVLCREAPLAERIRRGVGRRGQLRARGDELAQQAGHHHRVTRVVELELVDAQQLRTAEQLDRLLVADRAHERRVLDERAEVLPPAGERMVDRRQGASCRRRSRRRGTRRAAARAAWACARACRRAWRAPRRPRTAPGRSFDSCCDGYLVGAVGLEPRVVELGRGRERGDHLGPGHLRLTLDEVDDAGCCRAGAHEGFLCRSLPARARTTVDRRRLWAAADNPAVVSLRDAPSCFGTPSRLNLEVL